MRLRPAHAIGWDSPLVVAYNAGSGNPGMNAVAEIYTRQEQPARNAVRAMRRGLKFRYRLLQARRGRARGKSRFIGVTGSSGKSTTTALISHILAARSRVDMQLLAGTIIPLMGTLARQRGAADFVVVEIGASNIGTIGPMAKLLRPDVAIVTMVRIEHYAAFSHFRRRRRTISCNLSRHRRPFRRGDGAELCRAH